jgi:gas vesicle structural protein
MTVKKTLASNSLAEIMDRILDKGIIVDAWARSSLLSVELRSMETPLMGVGVDDYLRYAEAVGLTVKAREGATPF